MKSCLIIRLPYLQVKTKTWRNHSSVQERSSFTRSSGHPPKQYPRGTGKTLVTRINKTNIFLNHRLVYDLLFQKHLLGVYVNLFQGMFSFNQNMKSGVTSHRILRKSLGQILQFKATFNQSLEEPITHYLLRLRCWDQTRPHRVLSSKLQSG